MTKRAIHSDAAPAALGPYAQAVRAGNTLYLSGQIGLDPGTGELREGFDAQLEQVFENLKAVAEAGGASLDDAVKFTVFLTDLANFGAVNEKMAALLTPPMRPAPPCRWPPSRREPWWSSTPSWCSRTPLRA